MALVACKECGKEVSKKAEACPHCGFKPKRTSLFTWIVAIFIGVPILLGIVISAVSSDSTSGTAATQPAPEKTAAQIAAEQKEKVAEQKREALRRWAILGAEMLKKSMRNPDSFKVASALAMEKTGAICYEYRAQNGFGGMNVENAVLTSKGTFKNSGMDGFTTLWNKDCANQSGIDYADEIH